MKKGDAFGEVCCGIKSVWSIFKAEIFIYQSKANSDGEILAGRITHLLEPEIRKILIRGLYGNEPFGQ